MFRGSSSGNFVPSVTIKPGMGVAVIAMLSDSDLKEYRTKSTCKANHRLVQGLLACVFSSRYPDNTDDALADTCNKLGTGPEGDDGDLVSG
jgi:hypothetical protein